MTTIEKVPAHLVTDFDVYDPTLADPVDVMQDKVAELAASVRWCIRPRTAGTGWSPATRKSIRC